MNEVVTVEIWKTPPVDPAGNMLDPGWYWMAHGMTDPTGPFTTLNEAHASLGQFIADGGV